ncbi:hypothetical protein C8Q79DRAFT_926985 [Trametes meyenii]|nr:hypothetical protein C8Q79DRAFT_926985 [Trametes meyenii]
MFFTVLVYVCAFAFAGVFQGLADDSLLPYLTSVFNIPTLSAFNILPLAGLVPRPTLPPPDLATPINSVTDVYPLLPLSANFDDPVYAILREYYIWYQLLGSSSGFLATVLTASSLLVSWYIYTIIFKEITPQYQHPSSPSNISTTSYNLNDIIYPNDQNPVQHIILPTTATQNISMPVSADSPARDSEAFDEPLAPAPDIYDHLFGASSGEQIFEPITSPVDMDQQLCDIIVNSTKGGAVVDCGEGKYPIFAAFDSDEMYHVGVDWLEGYDHEGEEEGWYEDHG